MVSSAVYSGVLRYCMPSYYNAREIKKDERIRLVLVSVLFIVNIVLGNVSIKYCSLALDQVPHLRQFHWIDCEMHHARLDGRRSVPSVGREALGKSVSYTCAYYRRRHDGLQGRGRGSDCVSS